MKKTIVLCFLAISVLCVKAQEFNPQPIKTEIAGLEQKIAQAKAESEKYNAGLIKALLDSRLQILEQTKAMLEQRLAAGNYKVAIKYTVSGKEYIPPTNKDKVLLDLEREALNVSKEMEIAQKEADKYSGGLIQAMKLSTVATFQQQLAMIEMKRCALIYDIPLFALSVSGPASSVSSPTETTKEAPAEIDGMFDVKLTGKHIFKANYSDHLGFDFIFTNHTEKNIKAVKGIAVFCDLFDKEIMSINFTIEKNIPAGKSIENSDYSMKLNEFKDEHNRLSTISMDNLKMRFETQAIIFTNGSTVKR